ncbi:MAG: hypothetical protein ACJ75J_13915 [Cytophagaceae bacterium]
MHRIFFILLILTVCIHWHGHAQKDTTVYYPEVASVEWKERGLTLGANYSRYFFGEIGHYRSYVWEAGGFPTLSTLMSYGSEVAYLDKLVAGPKIQARMHAYIFNGSISSILYTDFKNGYCVKLRPELGIGLWNFDLNYGYNFGIVKNEFDQVNRHIITFRYYLRLKRKFLNELDRDGNSIRRKN